jgi:hypothetical protein
MGIGTTSTAAEAGRRSEANTADQPGGSGVAAAAGNGFGTIATGTVVDVAATAAILTAGSGAGRGAAGRRQQIAISGGPRWG